MGNEELEKRVMDAELDLAKLGESCKSAHRRMNDIDQLSQNVFSLTNEVHVAIAEMKNSKEKMDRLGNRLIRLEKQPAKEFQYCNRAIVSSIFTGVSGALLGAVPALVMHG